jgi:hypothetical protein
MVGKFFYQVPLTEYRTECGSRQKKTKFVHYLGDHSPADIELLQQAYRRFPHTTPGTTLAILCHKDEHILFLSKSVKGKIR